MRKPQTQPSLATLTEAEREQLAEWLRREHYDVVRDRVNKPRPEGFGLNISEKPLRTFYAKVALLDLINSRIEATAASSEDKKLTLATFESLAAGEILLMASSENEKSSMPNAHCSMNEELNVLTAEAHAALLRTTHDLATSGSNTPAQLLSLQRLADFPARAQLRQQRAELDQQKHDHKVELDTFRKQIATQRLALTEKNLSFRQKQHEDRLTLAREKAASKSNSNGNPAPRPKEDQFGPFARNWRDVGKRVQKGLNLSDEEVARRAELRRKFRTGELKLPDHCGMSNYQRLRAGDPSESALPSADFSPAAPVAQTASLRVLPSAQEQLSDLLYSPSAPSASSAVNPPSLSSEDLAATVDAYTVRRAKEYWAYRREYSAPPPPGRSHPDYITEYRHCPCGGATPCPVHESEETSGPFPNWFWSRSPHSVDYAACLRDRGLPYRNPTEFL